MSQKPDKDTLTAPAASTDVALQGRFDAFEKQMNEAIRNLKAAVDKIEERFGQLVVGAPRSARGQTPLSRAEVEAILLKRPSASFRLLQGVQLPSFSRGIGAIIRPQTLESTTWRTLLQQAKLEDADENP